MWETLLREKSALVTALDLLGDKWTLMIVSGNLASVYRFNELEKSLGINRNLLSSRLNRLIEAGIIEKIVYQEKPRRYEYRLTEIGKELRPVIVGLASWSERNITRDDTPISMVHKKCRTKVTAQIFCPSCDTIISNAEIETEISAAAGDETTRVFKETRKPFID